MQSTVLSSAHTAAYSAGTACTSVELLLSARSTSDSLRSKVRPQKLLVAGPVTSLSFW